MKQNCNQFLVSGPKTSREIPGRRKKEKRQDQEVVMKFWRRVTPWDLNTQVGPASLNPPFLPNWTPWACHMVFTGHPGGGRRPRGGGGGANPANPAETCMANPKVMPRRVWVWRLRVLGTRRAITKLSRRIDIRAISQMSRAQRTFTFSLLPFTGSWCGPWC